MNTQTQTTAETKKSKLISKQHEKMVGAWFKYFLTFENGDSGSYFLPEPLNRFTEGDTIEYSILNENGENKLRNVKKVFVKPTNTFKGSNYAKKDQGETNLLIARQTSLKCYSLS